ncbi:GyrI-like domain-containing protein [Flavobacterium amniphilum]|uniref:GyrI-like domain-containing protein n=1 Tax=Flavobacterium amniphilum TaxID=1834035 RepID=UPI00202AA294|nr:GyrI-like domain-containing protein [Flavobacterium amniphilum]MCL9804355.1 GyrI-like domain-containing protein [Flavobacterium amniphilum]
MNFEIVSVAPKKLVGKSLSMSFVVNKTGQLWAGFMPLVKKVQNRIGGERISLQIYSDDFMQDPTLQFTKWALVEVVNFDAIPNELEQYNLTGGLYAVFPYKGNVIEAPVFFEKIFSECIPASNYKLDNSRPHFEIIPEGKYDPMNPDSEEDIYIPVKLKE